MVTLLATTEEVAQHTPYTQEALSGELVLDPHPLVFTECSITNNLAWDSTMHTARKCAHAPTSDNMN